MLENSCAIWKVRSMPRAEQLVGSSPVTSSPSKMIVPAVGHDIAGDHVEQRRFARAVGADQPGDRAALDLERAIVDGREAAKALADVLHVDNCVEGHPAPVCLTPGMPFDPGRLCGICA